MNAQVADKIEQFFIQFRPQMYKKGEIIIRADEDPSGIFYLKSGMVKQYAISRKGDELVVNIYKPVVFFPMSWAINKTPNNYYWEAITDLQVYKAPAEKAVEFLKENPDVLFDLLSRVYRGTDGLLTRMTYLMSGSAYTRLLTEMIIHAKRFGGHKTTPPSGKTTEIVLTIAEKDLATRSGMTRETVSREMKTMKEKGLVSFHKNLLTIKDLSLLEEELLTY